MITHVYSCGHTKSRKRRGLLIVIKEDKCCPKCIVRADSFMRALTGTPPAPAIRPTRPTSTGLPREDERHA